MIRQIQVGIRVQAAHSWPDAVPNRRYLSHPHVHDWTIRAWARVGHNERDIEFHDLQHLLHGTVYRLLSNDPDTVGAMRTFGACSCETIAEEILTLLPVVHRVQVMEDDLVGATLERRGPAEGRLAPVPTRIEVDSRFAEDYAYSERPDVVTLCGSTKFPDEFKAAEAEYEMEGIAVFTVGFFAHAEKVAITEEQKTKLDELHKWKIALSDFIFVVNPGGYIGSSTRSEIEFARSRGIPVHYLVEPEDG